MEGNLYAESLYPEGPYPESLYPEDTSYEQLKNAAKRLFSTKDGEVFIEALRARTVLRPVFPSNGGDGQTIAMLMALREGENNLFRYIEMLLKPTLEQDKTRV